MLAVGLAVGALVTGLTVPFAVGDRAGSDAGGTQLSSSPRLAEGDRDALAADTADSEGTDEDEGVAGRGPATSTTATPTGAADPGPAPGGAPGQPGIGSEAVQREASDVGVTPTTIKIGFVLLDLSTANAVGLAPDHYEEEDQRKAYQAQVDAINAAGGIHGRKIETVYAVADPFNPDTALAACARLTEDERVFAVGAFAGYTAEGMLCVGRQHKTPIVVFGWPPEEHFRLTGGLLVSDGMQTTRMMFNWVHELDRLGLLDGKKIGIVGDENSGNGDKQAVEQGLLPALRQYRYEVTYRTRLSEDLQTAASQIPVEVQRMRAAGVDTVMLPTSFLYATQFVQAAEGQGWRPQYHVSDLQGLTCDVCVDDMPSSFDGTYGFTDRHFIRGAREGMPEPTVDRVCRQTYNRNTGENWQYGDRHPLYNACVQVEMIRRALTAAGVNPTRASWVANVPRIGDFALPTTLGGGFDGKNDYADVLVTIRWDEGCADSPRTADTENGCYRTIDQPRRARY